MNLDIIEEERKRGMFDQAEVTESFQDLDKFIFGGLRIPEQIKNIILNKK